MWFYECSTRLSRKERERSPSLIMKKLKSNKNLALIITILLVLVVAAGCSGSQPDPSSSGPSLTLTSLELALSNGQPTLAEFGSVSCIPCKQMKPILDELAEVYQDKLNVVIIDVYEQQELAQKYKVMAIPTQIIFDSSGTEISRHVGVWQTLEIMGQLKKIGIQ